MADPFDLDELEADLGPNCARKVIAALGGQSRSVPKLEWVTRSTLAREIGPVAARWIAERFGGSRIAFPSQRGQQMRRRAALIAADVLEAGLDHPKRSANDIAQSHGVTARRVQQIRKQLREDRAAHETRTPPNHPG